MAKLISYLRMDILLNSSVVIKEKSLQLFLKNFPGHNVFLNFKEREKGFLKVSII